MPDLTPTEARERLDRHADNAFGRRSVVDAILATTDALAALLDPAVMLPAWERAGKVEHGPWPATCTPPVQRWWRLTNPEEVAGIPVRRDPSVAPGTFRLTNPEAAP